MPRLGQLAGWGCERAECTWIAVRHAAPAPAPAHGPWAWCEVVGWTPAAAAAGGGVWRVRRVLRLTSSPSQRAHEGRNSHLQSAVGFGSGLCSSPTSKPAQRLLQRPLHQRPLHQRPRHQRLRRCGGGGSAPSSPPTRRRATARSFAPPCTARRATAGSPSRSRRRPPSPWRRGRAPAVGARARAVQR